MQIIIPMAGVGQRFKDKGYQTIKPLITVHEKPIIEHVTRLFPNEEDFLFICNNEHLTSTNLREILLKLKPHAKVVGIDGHEKGPVASVAGVYEYIKDSEPAVVNYCDFFMGWDWEHFKKTVREKNADGAVVCYTGFHPHLLGPNFYAGVRTDEEMKILEIKEKHCFAKDKTQGWHSAGTYYFKNGKILKEYFKKQLDGPSHQNGEHYASLPYNYMIQDGLLNLLYPVSYFCQWGTPEDLETYNLWHERARNNYQPQDETEKEILNYWQKFFKLKYLI